MKKKEIKEICEATFRRMYSFPKEDYRFFDWDIEMVTEFDEYSVRVYVLSKRHTIYRCHCWINENGEVNCEACKVLG